MANSPWPTPIEGGCACGSLRYRLEASPMFIHCCNCIACQVETGTSYALNAMLESTNVKLLPGKTTGVVTRPKMILTPSESGLGQMIARCPECFVAVWSHYQSAGPHVSLIRTGTVDKKAVNGDDFDKTLTPDMCIYTDFKQGWVEFSKEARKERVVGVGYDQQVIWPKESLERRKKLDPKIEEWVKSGKDWKLIDEWSVDILSAETASLSLGGKKES